MVKLLLAGSALAAAALPAAASAATFISPTPSGYFIYGTQSGAGMTYTDTYTINTTMDELISGSFSTQALFDGATEISDLDITSFTFNGTALTAGAGNTSTSEAYYLPSTLIGAGMQTLSLTYTVNDATVAPSYSGTLTLAPVAGAVPEPATWAMLGAGFGMIGFGFKRRNRERFAQAI